VLKLIADITQRGAQELIHSNPPPSWVLGLCRDRRSIKRFPIAQTLPTIDHQQLPWNLSKPNALSFLHGRRCEMSLDIGKVAIALLGLLAYKNRDKIGELITGKNSTDPNVKAGSSGGLGEILDRLRNAGAGDQVDSWVSKGSNRPINRDQVEKAIDPQTLRDLAEQTGLPQDELLDRLTRELPDAVDKLTPDGQMPASTGPNLLDEIPPDSYAARSRAP
jgi:uncharacterized protein YidB (DUF937 family)